MGDLSRAQDRVFGAVMHEGQGVDGSVEDAFADYYDVVRRQIVADLTDDLERIQLVVTDSQSEMGHVVLGWVRDILYRDMDVD